MRRSSTGLAAIAMAVGTAVVIAMVAVWQPGPAPENPVTVAPAAGDQPMADPTIPDLPIEELPPPLGAVPALPIPGEVPLPPQPLGPADAPAPDSGARVVGLTPIAPRIVDLAVESRAMGGVVPVRLILPRDWGQPRRFPTLYLMPGYGDPQDYRAWTHYTDAERFFADKNALVVMPSAGRAGFFSDWWNYGRGGNPGWETFHTKELPQIMEREWGGSDRRAVAGLSMGGFGAMSYAARNPGFYDAAASYSGYLHSTLPGLDRFTQVTVADQDEDPYALWGDPVLQAGIWADHDPWVQAEGLRGTDLFISSAMGARGDHDAALVDAVLGTLDAEDPAGHLSTIALASSLETIAYATTVSFQTRLQTLGIPVTTSYRIPGTHSWGYWQEELHRSWPVLAGGLGLPA